MLLYLIIFFGLALVPVFSGPEPCLSDSCETTRYVDVTAYRDVFAVLRSDGMVELADGHSSAVIDTLDMGLQCSAKFVLSVQDALIAGSDNTMICLLDGDTVSMKLPAGAMVCDAEAFAGAVLAVGGEDCAYYWDSPFSTARRLPFSAKGKCVDLSGADWLCCALTDCSELVMFNASLRASVFDFNGEYSRYYGQVSLKCVAVGSESVCVAGTGADGRPVAFMSSKGSVWSERPLEYTLNGRPMALEAEPVAVAYNEAADEFVLLCSDGTLFHLPSCSHCNYPEFTDSCRPVCLAFNGDSYLVAGDSLY